MKYTITIELTMQEPQGFHSDIPLEAELAEQNCWREMLVSFFCHQQGVYENIYLESIQQMSDCCLS